MQAILSRSNRGQLRGAGGAGYTGRNDLGFRAGASADVSSSIPRRTRASVRPVRPSAIDPMSHSGIVSTRNTAIENAAAVALSRPKNVSPATTKNWNVPTFAGAFGIAVPRCTIKNTAAPIQKLNGNAYAFITNQNAIVCKIKMKDEVRKASQ